MEVLSGRRPERPKHPNLTDELWDLIKSCWEQEPLRRPGISDVVDHLQRILTAQKDHADVRGITMDLGGVLCNALLRLRDAFPSVTRRLRLTDTISQPTPHKDLEYRRFDSLPNSSSALDDSHYVELDKSETSLHGTDLEESDELVCARNTPFGLCGLLRGVAFWKSNNGATYVRGCHSRLQYPVRKGMMDV